MKRRVYWTAALASAGIASSFGATNANADDWECTVMLCLSNPAGPTAVAECIPPVEKLLSVIRSGGAPKCDSGGADGVNLQISRGSKSRNRWFEFSDSTGQRTRTYY